MTSKILPTVLLCLCLANQLSAQDKKGGFQVASLKVELPEIRNYVRNTQGNVSLFAKNAGNHSQEHDVNSIILDIERYIDSMPKSRSYSDQLLMKQFNPLRHFFLTTTNKTTVATSFLYMDIPYRFCSYNDTAIALYLFAIKDGSNYNLGKTTEKKIQRLVLESCLLPAIKAVDEFKVNETKYIGLSVYYGCKDTRDGAPAGQIVSYCMTLIARLADLQQYSVGQLTARGLLDNAELYVSDEEDNALLKRTTIHID